jgi:hypothetical protein
VATESAASILLVALIGADTLIDTHAAQKCADPSSDNTVSACSQIIEGLQRSEKDRAIAYLLRGRAFMISLVESRGE